LLAEVALFPNRPAGIRPASPRYVLVEAENEGQARALGRVALEKLHAEVGRRLGKRLPVNILVVRPATTDEIEFCRWGEEMIAQEQARKSG
jgi:hypothetical protein